MSYFLPFKYSRKLYIFIYLEITECIGNGSQSVAPRSAVSASSVNLLEMQNFRLYSKTIKSDALGVESSNLYFNKLFV